MLNRVRNILKKLWKELLIIASITIILLGLLLLVFNLKTNKKVVSNKVVSKNKKFFNHEFNREFISDNERIIIVKNSDIINQKIIFDLDDKKISKNFDYDSMKGITREAKQRLKEKAPYNVGQASRISGVTPADISVLLMYLEGVLKQ